jgi:tRNA pseudouridine38-40 synthase
MQPGARTVEGEALSALMRICRISEDELDLRLASRTDRGVNALGNVAVFNTPLEDPTILLKALNAVSRDVFYRSIAEVGEDFNPRHADRRLYRQILQEDCFDVDAANRCAALFEGEHDFVRFCKADGKSTVLTMNSVNVWKENGLIVIDFEAGYYLWNMVRRMSAAIAAVGRGDAELSDVERALSGESIGFGLARADALTLRDVVYDGLDFIEPEGLFDDRVREELFRDGLRRSFFASL